MYEELPCVFWVARVKYGRTYITHEEYMRYKEEWEGYSVPLKGVIWGYVQKTRGVCVHM